MFAVFGTTSAEEEARRGLVHDKQKGIWYEDRRHWKRLGNTRYQISPAYSDYGTALEFCRLAEGNEDMHIVGILRMEEGIWKPYRAIRKIKQEKDKKWIQAQ